MKADALSRNPEAKTDHPASTFEEKIYGISFTEALFSIVLEDTGFTAQIKRAQLDDDVISHAMIQLENGELLSGGLKRVQKQLRIDDGVLTKTGRPVVPRIP